MLIDTGPIIALLDGRDANHRRCLEVARVLPNAPLYSTWCCFTEAMYFMAKIGGFAAQQKLWELLSSRRIILHMPDEFRMAALMKQYQDTPMDLADASLVALAEELETSDIFTLDRDFYVYRLANGQALRCVP
jgi:uncharacterized protein